MTGRAAPRTGVVSSCLRVFVCAQLWQQASVPLTWCPQNPQLPQNSLPPTTTLALPHHVPNTSSHTATQAAALAQRSLFRGLTTSTRIQPATVLQALSRLSGGPLQALCRLSAGCPTRCPRHACGATSAAATLGKSAAAGGSAHACMCSRARGGGVGLERGGRRRRVWRQHRWRGRSRSRSKPHPPS
jgi:hypothetical protein